MADRAPSIAVEAVLKPSCHLPLDVPKVKGYDFNQGADLRAVMKSYLTTGFQATSLGLAIQEINKMVKKKWLCSQHYLNNSHSVNYALMLCVYL